MSSSSIYIPTSFYINKPYATATYSRKPSALIDPLRLIRGQPYFQQLKQVNHHDPKKKVLLFNDWRYRYWPNDKKLPVLDKLIELLELGFVIYGMDDVEQKASLTRERAKAMKSKLEDLKQYKLERAIRGVADIVRSAISKDFNDDKEVDECNLPIFTRHSHSSKRQQHALSRKTQTPLDEILIVDDWLMDCLLHQEDCAYRTLYDEDLYAIIYKNGWPTLQKCLNALKAEKLQLVQTTVREDSLILIKKIQSLYPHIPHIIKLEELDFSDCNSVSKEATNSPDNPSAAHNQLNVFLSQTSHLKRLKLPYHLWLDSVLSQGVSLPVLKELELWLCDISTTALTQLIGFTPRLQRLKIVNLPLSAAKQPIHALTSTSLKVLKLTGLIANAEAVEQVLKLAPHLKRLKLITKLNLEGNFSEALQLTFLEELILNFTNIPLIALEQFLNQAPRLKKLDLTVVKNGLTGVFKKDLLLPALERLYLSGSNINLNTLEQFLAQAPRLKKLKLYVNKSGLTGVFKKDSLLPALERLYLSCSNINLNTLEQLLIHAPRLKNLTLLGSWVSDSPMELSGSFTTELSLPALEELKLYDTNFSANVLNQLLKLSQQSYSLTLDCSLDLTTARGSNLLTQETAAFPRLVSLVITINEFTFKQLLAILNAAPKLSLLAFIKSFPDKDNKASALYDPAFHARLSSKQNDPITALLKQAWSNWSSNGSAAYGSGNGNINGLRFSDIIGWFKSWWSPSGSPFSAGLALSRLLPPPKSLPIDAVPSDKKQHFNLDRLFFSSTGPAPEVNTYRLQVFNTLTVNARPCAQKQAFLLEKKGREAWAVCQGERRITFLAHDVYELLPKDDDSASYYYGRSELQLSNTWQPLPSLAPHEVLLHCHITPPVDVEINYSARDNLYYIRSKQATPQTVTVAFNLRLPKQQLTAALPKAIATEINMLRQFKSKPLSCPQEKKNGIYYLNALRQQRTGACRHRAILFKHFMEQHFPAMPTRVITNDCHAFIEVYYNHQWQAIDLGGSPATLGISNRFSPTQASQTSTSETRTLDEQTVFIDWHEQQLIEQALAKQSKTPITPLATLEAVLCTEATNQLIEVTGAQPLLQTALAIEALAQTCKQPLYRIDTPDDLICSAPFIKREGEIGHVCEGPGGPLHNFLLASQPSLKPPVLVVNYRNFSASDIVRLNALIDELRFADGTPLPSRTIVIGLIDPDKPDVYQGADFYSRFHHVHRLACVDDFAHLVEEAAITNPAMAEQAPSSAKAINVELFKAAYWQTYLLGSWQLSEQRLTFSESAFVHALKHGHTAFILNNPPEENEAFQRFIDQATLYGGFWLEGEWIALPAGFTVSYHHGFDWDALIGALTSTNAPLSKHTHVLNEQTLVNFMGSFSCDNATHTLVYLPGMLERNPKTTLRVYLTHDISIPHWAELLTKANRYQVRLDVSLAPGVGLPFEHPDILPALMEIVVSPPPHTRVIASEDVDLTVFKLVHAFKQAGESVRIIDVSEMDASTLLQQTEGQFNAKEKCFHFESHDGVLCSGLAEGHTIVLKGLFQPALIQSLAPVLLQRLSSPVAVGQLVLITSDKALFHYLPPVYIQPDTLPEAARITRIKKDALQVAYPKASAWIEERPEATVATTPLAHLKAQCRYHLAYPTADNTPWLGMKTLPYNAMTTDELELTDSPQKTRAFFSERLERLEAMLTHAPFVFITGLTGVGKSTFVLETWQAKHGPCHHGMPALKAWATDVTPGMKTLFIDEANINYGDYSAFEGLLDDQPSIVIGTHYIPLTHEHKVIFAGNPVSYGGERRLARLLERHGNSCLFTPLPPYVLYEATLKPIFDAFHLDETASVALAEVFLNTQQTMNNKAQQILVSPRELVTMALLTLSYLNQQPDADVMDVARYYAQTVIQHAPNEPTDATVEPHAPRPSLMRQRPPLPKSRFIYTPSRQALADCLDDLIHLRVLRQQQSRNALAGALCYGGLNALLIEGVPGIGKSALVVEHLQQLGFQEGTIANDHTAQNVYYRLPASMALAAKQRLLMKAFDEGALVIADEINTSLALEQLTNALLSGYSPEGKRARCPGFLLLATQNPIHMAGRRPHSQALKRRMLHYQLAPYTDEEIHTILNELGLAEPTSTHLIQCYRQQQAKAQYQGDTPPCFRELLKAAEQLKRLPQPSEYALSTPTPNVSTWHLEAPANTPSIGCATFYLQWLSGMMLITGGALLAIAMLTTSFIPLTIAGTALVGAAMVTAGCRYAFFTPSANKESTSPTEFIFTKWTQRDFASNEIIKL